MNGSGSLAQLASILQGFTPGAFGIWTGVLMFAAWMLKEWRETRKLSSDDRLARREGYQKQVELLTAENRAIGEDMRKLRREYDDYRVLCHAETDALRQQVIKLQDDLAGMRRGMAAEQVALARRDLAQSDAPHAAEALDRMERHIGGDSGKPE